MSKKSPDAFRTISEVAEWLGVPTHVLRFWESRFTQVKPVKRAGGRRYYRPSDMELLGGIRKLLHDDGMTIRGVQKLLREEGVKHVAAFSPSLDEPVRPEATSTNVVDLDAVRETERAEGAEAEPTDAVESPGAATEAPADHGAAATAQTADKTTSPDTPETAPTKADEAQDTDLVQPAVASTPASDTEQSAAETEDHDITPNLFESPEQLDFMAHDAEAAPDLPGSHDAESAPTEPKPEPAAFDLSHIPDDPEADAEIGPADPPLAQRIRAMRHSGRSEQLETAAVEALRLRLGALRDRMAEHQSARGKE